MPNALVVDDEEDIGEFLKEQLLEMGLEAITAISGEEAVKCIQEREIHFAVVDLRLSTTMTGLEVIRAVQNKWPKVVVVAMSGYVDISLRQETGKLGVAAYFTKPDDVQPGVFQDKVAALLSAKGLM
jgi:DNA-binding NtrC family response regulator